MNMTKSVRNILLAAAGAMVVTTLWASFQPADAGPIIRNRIRGHVAGAVVGGIVGNPAAGARIGRRCSLGQNVFVANGVVIGNDVKIQNNVSVYEGVTLEDHVFCGPSMVFTNVKTPRSAFPRNTSDDYVPTRVRYGADSAGSTSQCPSSPREPSAR